MKIGEKCVKFQKGHDDWKLPGAFISLDFYTVRKRNYSLELIALDTPDPVKIGNPPFMKNIRTQNEDHSW